MLERLKQVLATPDHGGFAECRQCGTRVDDPTSSCHECGSTEVATYDL